MQFDWTTFILEIINFLVLIWLLQRLFYRPVSNAIARRRAVIDNTLSEARAADAAAAALKLQYDNRLEDWEKEKQAGYARLHAEIAAERVRLTEALEAELAEEREKASARDRQQNADRMRRVEEEATARAAEFASRLLSRLASPELERPICDAVIEDLSRLPTAQRSRLREALREGGAVAVKVTSAHPLDPGRREGLARALGNLAGGPVACEFEENPDLRAGLAISVGPWLLRANLRDELAFLTAGARHAG